MAETKPRGEQIRFISTKTGEHVLDTYLEACERDGRSLPAMIDEIFDEDGKISPNFIQFRMVDTTGLLDYEFQFRTGSFIDPDEGWVQISEDVFGNLISTCEAARDSASQSDLSASLSADAASGSALAAETSELNAATSESNAAQSAIDAESFANDASTSVTDIQNIVDTLIFDPIAVTVADSPVTAQAGKYYIVNTSGGAVTINLPSIAVVGQPTNIGVRKATTDSNSITVAPSSPDTINGSASFTIQAVGNVTFLADDLVTDDWKPITSSGGLAEIKVDTLADGVDFTAGTDTSITLSFAPNSENSITVTMDGVTQHHDTYSVSGTTLTFDATIPASVNSIEVRYAISAEFGVPNDTSISWSKFASSVIGALSDIVSGATQKFATCKAVLDYVAQWGNSNVIGINQTWQDMTASRAFETTYTNDTGKPIQVCASISHAAADSSIFLIDGVEAADSSSGGSTSYVHLYSFIIPNGVTYRINASGGCGISEWWELR